MKLSLKESLDLYCKITSNISDYVEYTAYIKTKDKQGFLNVMSGQGSNEIILNKSVQNTYFASKEDILKFLKNLNFEYEEIYFIERKIKKEYNYSVVD